MKKGLLSTFFIDLKGWASFAYVPVRDQNIVVRGRNWRLVGFVFFLLVLKKILKDKKPSGEISLLVFFNIEENRLEVELKLIWNLIKKEKK